MKVQVPQLRLHRVVFKRRQEGKKIETGAETGQNATYVFTICSDLSSIRTAALSSSSATHIRQGSNPNERGSRSIRKSDDDENTTVARTPQQQ